VVETVHEDKICHLVFVPLRHPDPNVIRIAKEVAEKATQTFECAGMLGVEMFLLADGTRLVLRDASSHPTSGSVLVNEIAPRPRNSGHYIIDACSTSQYGTIYVQYLASLGSTGLKVPSAIMLNDLSLLELCDYSYVWLRLFVSLFVFF